MTAVTAGRPPVVTRRPATADDAALLRALFEQTRDDLALLPPELVDLQYRARAHQFALDHPAAVCEVLVVGSAEAGAVLLDADEDAVRVVDIVIARAHRRRGIATAVLRRVIADAGDRPVRLSVWSENAPARALYDRLGFTARSDSSGYLRMERQPALSNRFAGRCA